MPRLFESNAHVQGRAEQEIARSGTINYCKVSVNILVNMQSCARNNNTWSYWFLTARSIYHTCVVHHSFLLLFHSVAIHEGKLKFTLLHKTKEMLIEMAQIRAQPFVDVVVQLLQRPFGSRSIADQT